MWSGDRPQRQQPEKEALLERAPQHKKARSAPEMSKPQTSKFFLVLFHKYFFFLAKKLKKEIKSLITLNTLPNF